jgi:hypothetical protein
VAIHSVGSSNPRDTPDTVAATVLELSAHEAIDHLDKQLPLVLQWADLADAALEYCAPR